MADKPPAGLRPYLFHGVELDWSEGDRQAAGVCPWCAHPTKFSVVIATGLWRCHRCNIGNEEGGGNAIVFLRCLWEASDRATLSDDYSALAQDRGLREPDTLVHWQVVRSTITGRWLVPAYGIDGKLQQLYRYSPTKKGMRLLTTPTLGHRLFGANLYDPGKPEVYLCEGPWDAMASWEILKLSKQGEGTLAATANPDVSLLAEANVLGVPGCNTFARDWCPLFAGKNVSLMYDSDHPRQHPKTGSMLAPAGYVGMRRVARILTAAEEPPASVNYLCWGTEGYDPDLPSGYDVKNHLNRRPTDA